MLEQDPSPAGPAAAHATLEFLLRRMRHKSDFPALSEAVMSIQRRASSELESVSSLTEEVLKDVALTHKLLRMVNTAYYRRAGGGTISTVSRAVSLIGFAGVRNLALSAVLVEHMENKGHAQRLKEEFLRTLMAGTLASELSTLARDSEEAFITTVFQQLGRLLTEFYLPEEAAQVRERLSAKAGASRADEMRASESVLGISFEALGMGVGRHWGMPEHLLRNMRVATEAPPPDCPHEGGERLRWLAAAAVEAADILLVHDGADSHRRIEALAAHYGRCLNFNAKILASALARARERLSDLTRALQLQVREGEPALRLLARAQTEGVDGADAGSALRDELSAAELGPPGQADTSPQALDAPPESILTAGIQDITNTMVENFRLNEVLRMILETMYRALRFRRVLFCLRDPRGQCLQGRFGLGDQAQEVSAAFRIALAPQGSAPVDLFSAVCLKGADTLIADASVPALSSRLPVWFRDRVHAPTFLLLPMHLKTGQREQVIGLIYADRAQAGDIVLSERELSLLRTLRNQAVMAFKQAA